MVLLRDSLLNSQRLYLCIIFYVSININTFINMFYALSRISSSELLPCFYKYDSFASAW